MHAAARSVLESGTSRKPALRCLIRTAPDVEAVARLEETAGDDVDLRWRALVRRAQLGGPVTAEPADPDPDAWVSRLTVRAATPDPAAKSEVWQALAAERSVPVSSVSSVATAFWSAGQERLLDGFAPVYLELLDGLGTGDAMSAMALTKWLFPLVGIDLRFVEQAEQLAPRLTPVVRANLLERTDLARRMLRSRG